MGENNVLRCFLANGQDKEERAATDQESHCQHERDTITEIILAVAITILIIFIITWLILSRNKIGDQMEDCCPELREQHQNLHKSIKQTESQAFKTRSASTENGFLIQRCECPDVCPNLSQSREPLTPTQTFIQT